MTTYPTLLSPLQVGSVTLANRVRMGSMHVGLEEERDGFERLARPRAGLPEEAPSRALGREPSHLATEWEVSRYLARSIKGQAAIDWTVEEERNKLLTEEIRDADRLPTLIGALGVAQRTGRARTSGRARTLACPCSRSCPGAQRPTPSGSESLASTLRT